MGGVGWEGLGRYRGREGGGDLLVKDLPRRMRHCGTLLSHERSCNPDKEREKRRNKRKEDRGGREGVTLSTGFLL